MAQQNFRYIRKKRDILLIDQGGTGGSSPLYCPVDESFYGKDIRWSLKLTREETQHCLASLPTDRHFYTTSVTVQDIEKVRKHFGYTQLNIYDISYGTRVAPHYLRRFPDQTRSIILDRVVSPEIILGPDIVIDAQMALGMIFERCKKVPQCNTTAFRNWPNIPRK